MTKTQQAIMRAFQKALSECKSREVILLPYDKDGHSETIRDLRKEGRIVFCVDEIGDNYLVVRDYTDNAIDTYSCVLIEWTEDDAVYAFCEDGKSVVTGEYALQVQGNTFSVFTRIGAFMKLEGVPLMVPGINEESPPEDVYLSVCNHQSTHIYKVVGKDALNKVKEMICKLGEHPQWDNPAFDYTIIASLDGMHHFAIIQIPEVSSDMLDPKKLLMDQYS